VISAAFSPDGGTLALARPDEVTLWATATGQITALTGFAGRVESVAFSPDGRTMASGEWQPPDLIHGSTQEGGTTTVRRWDLATGQATTLVSRQGCYAGQALAFHPGGHTLACCPGMDGTLQLRDLAAGQVITLTGHAYGIEAAAFSPDGRTLATGSCDATIRLWDVATAQTTAIVNPHGGYVVSVAFRPDGRILASTSTDRAVRLWDPATGSPPLPCSDIPSSSDRRRSAPTGTRWPPPAWTGPSGYGPCVNRPDAACLANALLTRSELTQATGHGPPPYRNG
jgi:WD40 repeat protein